MMVWFLCKYLLSFCQQSDKSNVHITFWEAGKLKNAHDVDCWWSKGKEDAREYTCDQNTKQHGIADN